MGSRIRTVTGYNDRPVIVPFDVQLALTGQLKLIVGTYYSEYCEVTLKLLPQPIIIDNIAYIFTVEDDNMGTYYYKEEVKNGRYPFFTESGICDINKEEFNLHLVRFEREYWEYETT